MKKATICILLLVFSHTTFSQENVLTFSEYLGFVKKFHPVVKQANLMIDESEAKLLKARGAFDPKIEVDFDRKKFKSTEYFNKLNAAFKIPTWYGIELKGNFEENTGVYLNPESTVPNDGLYAAGISFSLAKDLLINERMATLKQAKLFQKQAVADNQLAVNEILYRASLSYFKWLKSYREKEVHEQYVNNASLRFKGIKRGYELGDLPSIDTTEARIAFSNRRLNLEKAKLNLRKASLELANYLWVDNIPLEVQEDLIPDLEVANYVDQALDFNIFDVATNLEEHPKLLSLGFKSEQLVVDQKLKKNNLLPRIDLQYNFYSEEPEQLNTFNTANYKAGVKFSYPLFTRKERAELKLTNYKIESINFERQAQEIALKNKIDAVKNEITSYRNQIRIASSIVADYQVLLEGEERKFEIGESSLFLINSRESKLIENKLKAIEFENLLLQAKGKLFNVMGI